MEYDPEMYSSHSNPRPSQQSAEDDAGLDQEQPESAEAVPVDPKDEPVDTSFVWVTPEDGKEEPEIARTGSGSPAPSRSFSPTYPPEDSFEVKRDLIGKTCYPYKIEEVVSPKIGRTKSDRLTRTVSDDFTAPEGGLKLEPFSPRRDKAGVREDSVPVEEGPAKRLRSQSQAQAGEA